MRSLRRLIPYFRPYRALLAFGLVLVVVSGALASVIPWLLRRGIDAIRDGAHSAAVWQSALGMVGLAVVAGILRYLMREVMNGMSRRIEYDLRNDLFAHLARLDATYYARMRTGDLMARLTNDLSAVRMAAGPAIMYLVNTIAGGAFALVFMLRISPRLTWLALLPMVVLPAVTIWLGRLIHERFEEVQEQFSRLTTLAQENVAGTRIVRAYRQESAEMGRFRALNDDYLEKNMALARLQGVMNPSFGLLGGLGAVAVLGFGGQLVVRGAITVGDFVAFGIYLAQLTWPLIALGWTTNLFQRGAASMARLNDILDAEPALAEAASPDALPPAASGRSLEFRDVGFHYPAPEGAEPRWVLRGVSFTVPAGATLGIVGATGSGKSALIDLIPRVYDTQEGEVLLDGVPIRRLPIETLRREIGYVPQESLLFSDTIASNIAYGVPAPGASAAGPTAGTEPPGDGEGADEGDDTRWAARVAQLDETIAAFPGGYETLLGERGINLSGGQKQRAALARALARRPTIVLLDDALSAVDTHTEAEILSSLRSALAGRTAVIASHRITAIRDASLIVVLDGGRVVERGAHEELMGAGGRYAALLRRQQLEEQIEDVDAGDAAGETPAAVASASSGS